jgi:hypothetical protein
VEGSPRRTPDQLKTRYFSTMQLKGHYPQYFLVVPGPSSFRITAPFAKLPAYFLATGFVSKLKQMSCHTLRSGLFSYSAH